MCFKIIKNLFNNQNKCKKNNNNFFKSKIINYNILFKYK